MTKKNLFVLLLVVACLPFVAACGSNSITGPSPITTPTPVAQKMAVSITVNGVPVADGSTIHLAGSSNTNTVHTDVYVTLDFPSAQGTCKFSDVWWNGATDDVGEQAIHQTEVRIGGTNWNGLSGSSGDYKADATWFQTNGTMDHQIKTVHVVFD